LGHSRTASSAAARSPGGTSWSRERADIAALLAASAERAGARAQAADVTCRVDAAAGLTAVVDAGRIRQAVDNLIDNALRFAPPGTAVELSAKIAGGSVASGRPGGDSAVPSARVRSWRGMP